MLHRDIIKRNPFFALDSLLDNVFSEGNLDSHWMRSDIQETDTTFQIVIDLPGIKKNQVEVSLEEGCLVVEVKQQGDQGREDQKNEANKYVRIERRQQRYGKRVFQIGKGIDEEKIQAQLEDGVLHIELFKKAAEQQKRLITLN